LKTISMTLEDVFLRLTQHEEGLGERGNSAASQEPRA
jgi:hypothetical protein